MGGDISVQSKPGAGSTFRFTVVVDKQGEAQLPRSAAPTLTTPASSAPVSSAAPAAPVPAEAAQRTDSPARQPVTKTDFVSPDVAAFQEALRRAGRDTVRVLLVDDNIPNLMVAQAILETLGCVVTKAKNGLEAVAAYRSGTFDLVLMDCHMPEMDGAEATKAIRQIESFQGRRTPIIALTADAMDDNRRRGTEAGMDDQVIKPLTISVLTSRIRTWLSAA
jgi:hypothetical protein